MTQIELKVECSACGLVLAAQWTLGTIRVEPCSKCLVTGKEAKAGAPKPPLEPQLFDVGPVLERVKIHRIHRNGTSENHDEKPKNAFHVVELAMKHAPSYFPEGIRWQDLAKKDWAGIHRWLVKYPEFAEWQTLFDFVEAGGVPRLDPPVTVGWIGSAAIGQFMPCAREWNAKGRFNIPAYRKETRDHAMGYDLNRNGTVRR